VGKGNRSKSLTSELRIISGQWRGRKLRFPAEQHLRPTTDRIRETLFNWLSPIIHGCSCLDLYAGSGALGFEALSRGAANSHFVETNRSACKALEANRDQLQTKHGVIHHQSATNFLTNNQLDFDIIFIDPPFAYQDLGDVIELIANQQAIKPGGMVYIEQPSDRPAPKIPANWSLHREKQAGQVCYRLYQLDCSHDMD